MPTNIGANGAEYNALIPQIDENADIQTAFRLYHYGEGSSGLPPLNQNSIAGFLKALDDNKLDVAPEVIPLNANLNNYTNSGFYVQDSNVKAQSGTNYPLVPALIGFAYAGLLRVMNDGNNVYQEYQVGGITDGKAYWRSRFGNLGWTTWRSFSQEGHIHDDRYFTKTQSDAKYLPAIKYLNLREPTINNNQYTLSILDESALVMINNGSIPNNVVIPTNSTVPFVVGTQITVLQKNTGRTSVVGASGVTVNFTPGNTLRALWSSASLIKIGINEWVLVGDLA